MHAVRYRALRIAIRETHLLIKVSDSFKHADMMANVDKNARKDGKKTNGAHSAPRISP